MPTVSVVRDELFAKLGRVFTDDEFQDVCFDFGIELDEVTTEGAAREAEGVPSGGAGGGVAGVGVDDEAVVYKIDITANRYDLLCVEGLAKALRVFLGTDAAAPEFRALDPGPGRRERMVVKRETAAIRPFVVCAILRDVTFTPERYKSFIELQEKLHQNICRRRTLVAIGTHDYDTLQGPFTYEALAPRDIRFVPLKQTESFYADDLLEHYLEHDKSNLGKYVPIIQHSPVYPCVLDAKRTVCSLPPIINGAHSAISVDTKNVFIECTATDYTKARVTLETVVCMFSEYCSREFTCEQVEVEYEEGHAGKRPETEPLGAVLVTPDLRYRKVDVGLEYVNSVVGIGIEGEQAAGLLTRMMLGAEYDAERDMLAVTVPPTRSDILHPIDVVEDVAVSFGYNNISKTVPDVHTAGKPLPLNKFTDDLRREVACMGCLEVLTFSLLSKAECWEDVNRRDTGRTVVIGNPKGKDFQAVRDSLVPCMLKTLASNKEQPLPIRLFEAGDVCRADESIDTGARNLRRLCVAHADVKTAGFEYVHGVLDRVFQKAGVRSLLEESDRSVTDGYRVVRASSVDDAWEEGSGPFLPGRHAWVQYKGETVGEFGIIHPQILKNFDIPFPVSVLDLNIECLVDLNSTDSLIH